MRNITYHLFVKYLKSTSMKHRALSLFQNATSHFIHILYQFINNSSHHYVSSKVKKQHRSSIIKNIITFIYLSFKYLNKVKKLFVEQLVNIEKDPYFFKFENFLLTLFLHI